MIFAKEKHEERRKNETCTSENKKIEEGEKRKAQVKHMNREQESK